MIEKEAIALWFQSLQDDICSALETTDGTGIFSEDRWDRPGGGGGRSRVITNGHLLEKGGVNFSAVHGKTPEKILTALKLKEADFYATGVSIVMHPVNPFIPIIHMNVRYFEMSNGTYWFGGGIDLTPHYIDEEDARFFHASLKKTCDSHNPEYYPTFKKWADDYFYIKHRQETRGIGGIFFDHLTPGENQKKEDVFSFVQAVGQSFSPIYTHLIDKHKTDNYGEREKQWQYLRRGRYVEFNLVWDKGTKFGLDTEGRTESILMSLPPYAAWEYNHVPREGSAEHNTISLLSQKYIDWLT
uniref:coproporphyrinogen oxidase n=1 Tax=Roseihalotalea indica TaxID=2867963 RepID=A0AA49GU84_9BACT|nr:oxygen-dependent coproporphyrinogen oxidase [Tunicatimonas sp. TK19036]